MGEREWNCDLSAPPPLTLKGLSGLLPPQPEVEHRLAPRGRWMPDPLLETVARVWATIA